MTSSRSLVVAFALGAIAGASVVSRQYRDRDIHIIDQDGIAVGREGVADESTSDSGNTMEPLPEEMEDVDLGRWR